MLEIEFIYRKTCQEIMKELYLRGPMNKSKIAKNKGRTVSHIVKITSQLEELGFLKGNKEGASRMLYLTDNGRKLAEGYINIDNIINKVTKK